MISAGFTLPDGRLCFGQTDEAGVRYILHHITGWRAVRWVGPGYYTWSSHDGRGYDWRWSAVQYSQAQTWYFADVAEWHAKGRQRVLIDQAITYLEASVAWEFAQAV